MSLTSRLYSERSKCTKRSIMPLLDQLIHDVLLLLAIFEAVAAANSGKLRSL